MKSMIYIINYNLFGLKVANELVVAGRKVTIISHLKQADSNHSVTNLSGSILFVNIDYNDYTKMNDLEITEGSIILINFDEDVEKLKYLINFRNYFIEKNFRYIVPIEDTNLKKTFQKAGVTYVLSKKEILGKIVASYLFEKDVAEYLVELLGADYDNTKNDIIEVILLPDSQYCNMKYIDFYIAMKREFNIIAIGIVTLQGDKEVLIKDPDFDLPMTNAKKCILIAKACDIDRAKDHISIV